MSDWWSRNSRFLWLLALPLLLSAGFDRWQWERSRPTAENLLAWHRGLDSSPRNFPLLEMAYALEPGHPEVRRALREAYERMGWTDRAAELGP